MVTMILNNTLEFEFNDYSRNTYFGGESVTSEGYINGIKSPNASSELDDYADEPITSIKIKKDDEVIYNLTDISAKVVSINEGYNGNNVYVNVTLRFII